MKSKIFSVLFALVLILGLSLVTALPVAAAGENPTAPVLGEAGRFVILAGEKVTTTVGSLISDGDMGIINEARSYYEGFTPGANPGEFTELTNGLSYAYDDDTGQPLIPVPIPYASITAFIDQVRTDLGIAYTFLAADPNPSAPTQVCPTQLGGKTLTRGVYKTAANVLITEGTLTLDAQGDPDSVWIFSIDGTLTVGAPSGAIILENGAQAGNVYWRTADVTYIEAGITFYGNVFAWSQVNVLAGADVTGRLFAVTDQVTLIADTVTMPSLLPSLLPSLVGGILKDADNGNATWDSTVTRTGKYSVKLEAGSTAGISGASVTIPVPAIDIDDASVSDPTANAIASTAHGQVPYLNILLDTDADGVVDDGLEGLTSAGTTSTTAWTLIQEPIGYYDFDMSLEETSIPFETKTLAEWQAALDDVDVVGVQVVFGYCLWNDGQVVNVDDITINDITYDLEPIVLDAAYYSIGAMPAVTVLNGFTTDDQVQVGLASAIVVHTTNILAFEGDPGVFEGSFTLVDTLAGANQLVVIDSDTITAKYTGDWGAGEQTVTATATVDDTAPTVAITAPLTAADVKGTVAIATTVTEVNPYTGEIAIDGTRAATSTDGPPSYTWDTAGETDGSHTIVATATDAAGNVGTASVTVTVDNTAPVISLQVATPAVVKPTGTGVSPIIFTATVADVTSGVDTVKINLSSLTPVGGAAVSMLDGGVGADAVADDGIYTLSYVNNITGEGDYALPITATDAAGNTATANITLGVSLDPDPPEITGATITYDYNTSARPGDTFNISATVTDANTVGVVATCDAFDASVSMAATADPDVYTGTGNVKVTASTSSYPITITATDAKGNVATDTSLTLVVDPGAYGAVIDLAEGWNLISLPLIPDDDAIDVVLAGIGDISNVSSVYYWYNDGTSTGWQIYVPGSGGTLATMEDGKAYFVLMSGEDTLTITGRTMPKPGETTPPIYEVYAGWNFVGFKSLADMDNAVYLTNLVGSYTILWGYQPIGGYHLVYPPGTNDMEVGCGYWLWATESGIIVPPFAPPA